MPYDGLAMWVAAHELETALAGGRVEKVLQPEKDEIHVIIRSQGINQRLVCCCSPAQPRVLLSQRAKVSPLTAPSFCMLLRKRLIGGRVLSVSQQGLERVLSVKLDVRDELGIAMILTLYVEVMGKHSNIILANEKGVIIDSIKHVTDEMSRVRAVLPGLDYIAPPAQDKLDPLEMNVDDFTRLLYGAEDGTVIKVLTQRLAGLSQATARELAAYPGIDADAPVRRLSADDTARLAQYLTSRLARIRLEPTRPCLLSNPETGEIMDFLPFESQLYPPAWQQPRPSFQQAMDEYYALRDQAERMQQRTAHLVALVRRHLERCQTKLAHQQQTLDSALQLEQYRLYGELLTGYPHLIRRGMALVRVPNWYDPLGAEVDIPLDPARDGGQNAQLYYKKYKKAKKALDLIQRQMEDNRMETDYLEGQLHNLSACASESEVDEIAAELGKEGYISPGTATRRAKALPPSRPLHCRSEDGYDIYIGRNNLQNDTLTLHFARGDDIWLHTQGIPGSHVIIQAREGQVSPEALMAGALLAAWYSKARQSSGIPVDYTARKNIKKPSGAKPGYVIYSTHRTLSVTPDPSLIHAIPQVSDKA